LRRYLRDRTFPSRATVPELVACSLVPLRQSMVNVGFSAGFRVCVSVREVLRAKTLLYGFLCLFRGLFKAPRLAHGWPSSRQSCRARAECSPTAGPGKAKSLTEPLQPCTRGPCVCARPRNAGAYVGPASARDSGTSTPMLLHMVGWGLGGWVLVAVVTLAPDFFDTLFVYILFMFLSQFVFLHRVSPPSFSTDSVLLQPHPMNL
jgi:hypothetical protein